jgi:Magnesium chelatase, subunit ChlI C-terminal/Magnesium chelatase, subunit ChlI
LNFRFQKPASRWPVHFPQRQRNCPQCLYRFRQRFILQLSFYPPDSITAGLGSGLSFVQPDFDVRGWSVPLKLENSGSKPVRCPCGARAHAGRKKATSRTPDGKMPGELKSSPREIQNYLGRISGPLLDRIDLHVEVPPVKFREIAGDRAGETSAQVRERVVAARRRQHARFKHKPKITCNARMGSRELKQFCELDEPTKELLKNAMTEYNLSARAYDRILKVARTIADLAGAEAISSDHISEAIQYRTLDRQLWA